MIWSALARGLYWTLGAAQAVVEFVGATRRLVLTARKGRVPHVDDTGPIPLRQRVRVPATRPRSR